MSQTRTCLWVAVLALLAACGSDPQPENAAAAAAAQSAPSQPAVPAKVDPTAQMARAVGNGKPGAAVDIRYEFTARPEAGKPIELQVALIPTAGVDAMDVTFSGMEGITLAGTLSANFDAVQAGQPYQHTISVLPDHNGVFYVTAAVNTQMGAAALSKTFSIPFVVGSAALQQKPAAPAKDAAGQPVEPLPAQETTR